MFFRCMVDLRDLTIYSSLNCLQTIHALLSSDKDESHLGIPSCNGSINSLYHETTMRKLFTQENDYGEFNLTNKKQNYKHMKHPCTAVHKKE